jgi:hypothetical protein
MESSGIYIRVQLPQAIYNVLAKFSTRAVDTVGSLNVKNRPHA